MYLFHGWHIFLVSAIFDIGEFSVLHVIVVVWSQFESCLNLCVKIFDVLINIKLSKSSNIVENSHFRFHQNFSLFSSFLCPKTEIHKCQVY